MKTIEQNFQAIHDNVQGRSRAVKPKCVPSQMEALGNYLFQAVLIVFF